MGRWRVSAARGNFLEPRTWNQLRCRRTFGAFAQKTLPTAEPWEPLAIPPSQRTRHPINVDPIALVSDDLARIQSNLLEVIGSAHPDLRDMAQLYFLSPARQLRPIVIILISRAMNGLSPLWVHKQRAAQLEQLSGRSEEFDRPLTRPGVLESWSPTMPNDTESFHDLFALRKPQGVPSSFPTQHSSVPLQSSNALLPTQMRLAQIVEMINIASILHDGILPEKVLPSQCAKNTKLSILGGDFLLGRSSSALSRLGEAEVVELIASVISNIAEGELLQIPEVTMPATGIVPFSASLEDAWALYLKRTYMKTASLIANGARSSVILGGSSHDDPWRDIAYYYGRNLGSAYQITEDAAEVDTILNPKRFRLPTAPLLFAWKSFPEMEALQGRRFNKSGDEQLAKAYLEDSGAAVKTKALARVHASRARSVLRFLPESPERQALEVLTEMVVDRTWT